MHDDLPRSRRDFVRTATLATAAAAIGAGTASAAAPAPAVARGRRGNPANERLQFGLIGFGIRGRNLHGAFLDDDAVEIVSICDPCTTRASEGKRRID